MTLQLKENNILVRLMRNRPFVHVLFWLSYLCFYGFLWGSYDDNYRRSFTSESAELLIKIPMVYFFLNFLIDRYLFQKKYTEFFGLMFVGMIAAGFMHRAVYYFLIYPEYFPDRVGSGYLSMPRILKGVANVNSLMVLVVAIKILKKWYQDRQDHESLEKEKLEAELKFLKSQVHPHFLFNTLNNLYSLTLKKSDIAPEVVLKLSDLMSYMLYDASAPKVPLSKEIQYLQNYIALEKIRYGDRLDISFNISGDIGGKMIAPMLMLPFIENTFKHGVSGDLDTVWASIDLTVKGQKMVFKVENSKSSDPQPAGLRKGIGLENVRRRLDLLYGQFYELRIFDEVDAYLVVLKLDLEQAHASEQEDPVPTKQTVLLRD
jgi:sensor histidine kinase YesM